MTTTFSSSPGPPRMKREGVWGGGRYNYVAFLRISNFFSALDSRGLACINVGILESFQISAERISNADELNTKEGWHYKFSVVDMFSVISTRFFSVISDGYVKN